MTDGSSRNRTIAAWAVHLYTGLGLPLMFLGAMALFKEGAAGEPSRYFVLTWIAIFVDATDGFFARRVGVKEVLPSFSGRRLDDLVDFLNFAFLPALALAILGLFPEGWEAAACLPLMASGYGFCQESAKTDDAFVGFPSYWNIVVLYLFVLGLSPWLNLAIIAVLSVLVFVPIHYVYPTRTEFMMRTTLVLGLLWSAALLALSLGARAGWALPLALASFIYPVYYTVVSLIHHRRIHAAEAKAKLDAEAEIAAVNQTPRAAAARPS